MTQWREVRRDTNIFPPYIQRINSKSCNFYYYYFCIITIQLQPEPGSRVGEDWGLVGGDLTAKEPKNKQRFKTSSHVTLQRALNPGYRVQFIRLLVSSSTKITPNRRFHINTGCKPCDFTKCSINVMKIIQNSVTLSCVTFISSNLLSLVSIRNLKPEVL